jgi:putative transposase
MARPTRIEYEGAVYHVMARSNPKERLFCDDDDCAIFLKTLSEASAKCGWLVHAYALMGNHYHIALETPEANLVSGMQWLQVTYTVRFHRRHRSYGHLFAGRYKAIPVDPVADYFLSLCEYIHLNPARAGLVRDGSPIATYPWSSLPHYLATPKRRPKFLVVERGLGVAGCKDTPAGRREYCKGLDERFRLEQKEAGSRSDKGISEILKRGWFYGGEQFRAKLEEIAEQALKKAAADPNRSAGAPADHSVSMAEKIVVDCLGILQIEESQLPAMKKGAPEKVAIAWLVRRQTSVRLRWIAERLSMGHVSNVAVRCSEIDRDHERSNRPKAVIQKLRENSKIIT